MANAIPGDCRPLNKLPTLQRNALRKIFDRPDYTPEEVAGLGYRRIQQAEGIGLKGIATIQNWLREYGLDLEPDPGAEQARKKRGKRLEKSVEIALRVLQNHGYVVQGPGDTGPTRA